MKIYAFTINQHNNWQLKTMREMIRNLRYIRFDYRWPEEHDQNLFDQRYCALDVIFL